MKTERIVDCTVWGKEIEVHYIEETMSIWTGDTNLYTGPVLDLTEIEDLIIKETK